MKAAHAIFFLVVTTAIAACSTVHKNSSSSPAPVATAPVTPSSDSYLFVKPSNGIPAPGKEELSALQLQYKDVTMEKLAAGHAIYSQGACISCHNAKNIYQYDQKEWATIIDDMAFRANLSEQEKDAVYKYVLSIKATQATK